MKTKVVTEKLRISWLGREVWATDGLKRNI